MAKNGFSKKLQHVHTSSKFNQLATQAMLSDAPIEPTLDNVCTMVEQCGLGIEALANQLFDAVNGMTALQTQCNKLDKENERLVTSNVWLSSQLERTNERVSVLEASLTALEQRHRIEGGATQREVESLRSQVIDLRIQLSDERMAEMTEEKEDHRDSVRKILEWATDGDVR